MPAKIIETQPRPFNKSKKVDPITLDIIENALRNARTEMDAVLFRTAMSPGIREQHDAFPMIANPDGKMVVGQFGSFIYGFTNGYEGEIEEGDIFMTNDPYSCAGAVSHLNDWLMLMPIFRGGRLISWAAMFGHMTDIGGKVPGSLPTDAQQVYEEGIQIPPTKIYKRGKLNQDVLTLILHNCRLPEWNRADFNAIIAALRLAERRVNEICDRFGEDEYVNAKQEMLDRNKRAMSAIIQMVIPEKKQYFEDFIDDDGIGMGPYKVAC
ncbi:MAG: hydantoinase B/oxoprolinase family protein, partial [Alphaproteobacteria bacterium]